MNTLVRPRLHTVTAIAEPAVVRVEVGLALDGEELLGRSSGPPTDPGWARAAVQATLGALEQCLEDLRLGVDEVVVDRAGAHKWVTVVISVVSRSGVEQLAGAALIDGDVPASAVHATLQACNRRLGSLMGQKSVSLGGVVGPDTSSSRRPQGADLAGVVAHQLRGPATNMYGYLQLMRTRFDTLDDQSKLSMLDRSLAGCQRLLGRLENLLALAQDDPLPATRPQRVQVRAAAQQALADVPATTGKIEIRCPQQLYAWADQDHLVQMLSNYIDNAQRHGHPPVAIDAQLVDGWLEIAVTDAGSGIDGHTMAQLFAPPDGRRSGATAGAGLGLYVVGLLAHANAGSVDIRRAIPNGTRASIRLPPA